MKLKTKHYNLIGGFFILLGGIVFALTKWYNGNHENDPNRFGIWITIACFIVGMVFFAPWSREKKE